MEFGGGLVDSVLIRPAVDGDSERIAEINVFAWRTAYRGIVPDGFLYGNLRVVERVANIRKAISSGGERFFVAEVDGMVVGFTRFGPSRDESYPGMGELYALYVDPGFQRRGYGRRLIEHFLDHDLAASGRSLLWVFRDNHESRRFYEAMGFSVDGAETLYANLAPAVRYIYPAP